MFKVTPGGTLTPLASFGVGDNPNGGLVLAGNGNCYGTTQNGGPYSAGTVFRATPAGTLTTLHNFHNSDGFQVNAPLIQATDGNFYGTTVGGGTGVGTIFKVTPKGELTTVHNFDSAEGSTFGDLFQATNGTLYGVTYLGGTHKDGTIFSLSVGLGPFVETLPRYGRTEATIDILGTNLTAATSVSFNTTMTTFTVVSASEITATVPAGATTGFVTVTTPTTTVKSNVKFQVLP